MLRETGRWGFAAAVIVTLLLLAGTTLAVIRVRSALLANAAVREEQLRTLP